MKIELKNIRIAQNLSHETTAFTATIHIDGKKAATVENIGQGGSNNYHFTDHKLGEQFHQFCKAQPKIKWEHGELDCDADLYLNELMLVHEKALMRKKAINTMKRDLNKGRVIFTLQDDKKGSYRCIDHRGQPDNAVKSLRAKHSTKLAVVVVNEADIEGALSKIFGNYV